MSNETSKVAIVTGASRGIGAAVAERLGRDGFTVRLNYSRDARPPEALARKIESAGGRAPTAHAVAPGPTATDLFLNGKSPELIERFSKMAPLERLGTPADIAAAVAFLVSPDGGWINGQVLRANGGLV